MRGEKNGRRIADLLQALTAHREHPHFVGGTEAILYRPHDPEPAARLAFEIQHRIDHVLEHARAGDRTVLGDMAHEENDAARLFGIPHQARRGLAQLADGAWRRTQVLRKHGLDRIDDHNRGTGGGRLTDDPLDLSLGQQFDRVAFKPQSPCSQGHLAQRLLTGDIQHRHCARQTRSRLQQQCRLTNPRIPPEQDYRSCYQPATENPVQFTDLRAKALLLRLINVAEALSARLPGVATATARCSAGAGFLERIPRIAVRALTLPLKTLGAARRTNKQGFRPRHRNRSRVRTLDDSTRPGVPAD